MKINRVSSDYFLDITGEVCPMTFVKVRLQLEKMAANETLEVRLRGLEPLENVPDSITELGHAVISVRLENALGAAENNQNTQPVHRVVIRAN
ncbi:MAG: sulfurtransferase TusA family protein [Pseudomonadota bacterium]|nr:sulfurtransferase TusA family protein [Pseudomonadota bacterium]